VDRTTEYRPTDRHAHHRVTTVTAVNDCSLWGSGTVHQASATPTAHCGSAGSVVVSVSVTGVWWYEMNIEYMNIWWLSTVLHPYSNSKDERYVYVPIFYHFLWYYVFTWCSERNGDVIDSYSVATTTNEISVDGNVQKSCRCLKLSMRNYRTVLTFFPNDYWLTSMSNK